MDFNWIVRVLSVTEDLVAQQLLGPRAVLQNTCGVTRMSRWASHQMRDRQLHVNQNPLEVAAILVW